MGENPCPRGAKPLFCATWHDCRPRAERQERLDEWADLHDKPRESPRKRRPSWWDESSEPEAGTP
jgi:hypothetical protein